MHCSVVVSVIKSTHVHDVYILKAGVQSLRQTSESFHSDFERSLCCEVHRCDTILKHVALKVSNFYWVTLSSWRRLIKFQAISQPCAPAFKRLSSPLTWSLKHWYRTSISSTWPLTSLWRKTISSSLSGDQHHILWSCWWAAGEQQNNCAVMKEALRIAAFFYLTTLAQNVIYIQSSMAFQYFARAALNPPGETEQILWLIMKAGDDCLLHANRRYRLTLRCSWLACMYELHAFARERRAAGGRLYFQYLSGSALMAGL